MTLGIYGMGNIGTAVAALVAPPVAAALGCLIVNVLVMQRRVTALMPTR
jgi:nitrate/nitrite transporter NarK